MNEDHKDAPEYVYVKKTEGYEHNWYGTVASFVDEDAAEYIRSDLVNVNYDAIAYEKLKEEHILIRNKFEKQERELCELKKVLSSIWHEVDTAINSTVK